MATAYSFPRRGEVWQVSLDPTIGHEVKKTRPAIIVTSNIYNEYNWVVLVVPITSSDTAEYDQVMITPPEGGMTQKSVTLPDQLRAVDRKRLVKKIGTLNSTTVDKLDNSLNMVLGLSL